MLAITGRAAAQTGCYAAHPPAVPALHVHTYRSSRARDEGRFGRRRKWPGESTRDLLRIGDIWVFFHL